MPSVRSYFPGFGYRLAEWSGQPAIRIVREVDNDDLRKLFAGIKRLNARLKARGRAYEVRQAGVNGQTLIVLFASPTQHRLWKMQRATFSSIVASV